MEKIIEIKISLDDKASFETSEGKIDITDDVFEYLVEATREAIKETLSLNNDDFANSILENYNQKLPKNFKDLKSIGLKVEEL